MTSSGDDDVMAAAAARYRLRQLVRQHPPHDSDPRHCASLRNAGEVEELEQFDRQRRAHQLGRAQFFTTDLNTDISSNCTLCRQVTWLRRQLAQYDNEKYDIYKADNMGRHAKILGWAKSLYLSTSSPLPSPFTFRSPPLPFPHLPLPALKSRPLECSYRGFRELCKLPRNSRANLVHFSLKI